MQHLRTPTPRELGFCMPAEWEPHAATWTSWPFDEELWAGYLEPVRQEFAELVQTIARFEPVHLLVRDEEAEEDARKRIGAGNLTCHRLPLDDVWFRDNGPIFVRRGQEVSLVNWKFNAWGNKYEWRLDNEAPEYVAQHLGAAHWDVPVVMEGGSLETNGGGVVLTTRQCLLHPERNPHLNEGQIEGYLRDYLGFAKVLWLEGGLEGDHTDGHIDTIARFVKPTTIVACVEPRASDPNHATLKANLARLKGFTDLEGNPFEVVELPLPQQRLELLGNRLPPTYANFYIGNGFVVVPQYDDPNDALALSILGPLFPGREVIGLRSRALITGGGSFHCVTQQQPAGRIWKGD
ncbi:MULTISPECIES: agmatine/peptidylarginine deiminase [unclassified Meiothermus]|uniref:agmatine deiminase family protein n=1 Tax=unclassified Meiothermus TaxID=370471 RepID=UPI001F44CA55|nr:MULTISPECIES: agmatine deiminase family protein [unclassified Meiothermus]